MLSALKPRHLNPLIDQQVILAHIATKVERAADQMGFVSAIGTQAVLRCNGRVNFVGKKWVN